MRTAGHLVNLVFPHLAVRQWMLSMPKRLRYFLQHYGAALNMALRIFLRVIEHSPHRHCPSAARRDKASLRRGASTELASAGRGDGHGAGSTRQDSDRADRHTRQRA